MRRMISLKRFVSETDNLVLIYLIYCKPVKSFAIRNDMMKSWSSSDSIMKTSWRRLI